LFGQQLVIRVTNVYVFTCDGVCTLRIFSLNLCVDEDLHLLKSLVLAPASTGEYCIG